MSFWSKLFPVKKISEVLQKMTKKPSLEDLLEEKNVLIELKTLNSRLLDVIKENP